MRNAPKPDCPWYNAPAADWQRRFGEPPRRHNLRQGHSRFTAYAARELKDPALARRAWEEFPGGEMKLGLPVKEIKGAAVPSSVVEVQNLSTNAAAQWGLAAIENLALIGDALPH